MHQLTSISFQRSCFVFAHKGNSLPGEQNKIGFIKRQWRQFNPTIRINFFLSNNGDNYIQQLESISLYPKIIINYRKLFKISKVMFKDNSCQLNRQLTSISFQRSCFVFAHKGNSLPGEQNKIGFIKRQWRQFRHQLSSISFYPTMETIISNNTDNFSS